MDDDLRVYPISRIRPPQETRVLPPLSVYKKEQKLKEEKRKKKRRETFKDDFVRHFNLDENRYAVNLVKIDGKWMVEIVNRKSLKKVYQDYETVCNILDIHSKLPKIVGANVDMRV